MVPFSLTEVLFQLHEGMLKVPPVVFAKASANLKQTLCSYWLLQLQERIQQTEPMFKQISNWNQALNQHMKTISQYTFKAFKEAKKVNFEEKKYEKFEIPGPFYYHEEMREKLYFMVWFEKDGSVYARCRIGYDNKGQYRNDMDLETEIEDLNDAATYIDYFCDQTIQEQLERIVREGEDAISNHSMDEDQKEELVNWLQSNSSEQVLKDRIHPDKKTGLLKMWGFNLTPIKLDPENLAGWNPGDKPLTNEELLNITYKQYNKPAYSSLYVKCPMRNKTTSSFQSSTGETYNGLFLGFNPSGTPIEVVVDSLEMFDRFPWREELEEKLQQYLSTLEHELGHLAQDLLQHIKGRPQDNKRTGNYQFGVNSKNLSGTGERGSWVNTSDPNKPKMKTQHSLRDVEFYTNLISNYNEIKHTLSRVPKTKDKIKFFQELVGYTTNWNNMELSRMKELRLGNYKKWVKAVKLLYTQANKDNLFAETTP